jgi:formylglycine-generating enzyme
MSMKKFFSVAAIAAVTGLGASIASAQITIPTVPVGNAGNAPDPFTGNLYGSVAYTYNIGQTEVTNAQYAAFLNAKAATDTLNLYSADMAGSLGGIARSGSAGLYTYATISGRANNPVNFVSFWDSTRFANWLHNGQGSGDTDTGAYTLTADGISANTITRNAGWQWAVASENEWYKAAYHQPASKGGPATDYWLYPTQSNTITTAQANYNSGDTMPVGSYEANYYGTFDMGGNVFEWNDTIVFDSGRGGRGGSFDRSYNLLQPDARYGINDNPTNERDNIGFRVSQVPVPSSGALLAIGGLAALRRRRHAGR